MNGKTDYITRECEDHLARVTQFYPILSIMGPRQAGKTRLMREYFPHLPYYNLEQEKVYNDIIKSPEDFIRAHIDGVILDEFHCIPQITEVLKCVADELIWEAAQNGRERISTRFVVTGSHNYLTIGDVRETMVGRAAILELLSMTSYELGIGDIYSLMFNGGYPLMHVSRERSESFFYQYIKNYIQREIRSIHNITEYVEFQNFMSLCASRIGNILDYEKMSIELGVKVDVLKDWLSILEATYIVFRAPPYYKNFDRRLTHRPKLYFYDTGLATFLLGLTSEEELQASEDRGKIFENLVVSEIKKRLLNRGLHSSSIYFWNIQKGEEEPYEIDLLIKRGNAIKAIEIKISDKLDKRWFQGGARLGELTRVEKYVIYNGPRMETPEGTALNFKDIDLLF
jgi:predicted AAA+ superfamily ATPase